MNPGDAIIIAFFYYSTLSLGSNIHAVQNTDLVTISAGTVFRLAAEANLVFEAVFFNEKILENSIDHSVFYSLDYFCPDADNIFHLTEGDFCKIDQMIKMVRLFQQDRHVLPGIIHALLMLILQFYRSLGKSVKRSNTSGETFIGNFRSLIARNFLDVDGLKSTATMSCLRHFETCFFLDSGISH